MVLSKKQTKQLSKKQTKQQTSLTHPVSVTAVGHLRIDHTI